MKIIYKAATAKGEIKEGIIEARDVNQAVYFIRSKDLLPITVKQKQDAGLLFTSIFNSVGQKDIVLFTRQLSSMISSGLTLVQSLEILKEQMPNAALREIITSVIADVQEGKLFSYAISKYPKIFSPIYISLVKSGESSGLLDKIFERLANNLEKSQKVRGQVVSSLIYPAMVFSLLIIVMIIMVIFIVPQIENLYASLNTTLPVPTLIVIGISHFLINFWPLFLGSIALVVFSYKRWVSTDFGRILRDKFVISIPLIGRLVQLSVLTEFSRTLGLLINSGTLIVESLQKTSDIAGNRIYRDAIIDISHRVEKGITLGDAMATYDIFPPILVQMVKIGEQTGKLDESLLKVSEYFEREVEGVVKALTTAIEPIIMIVLGLGVAFLLIAIITPIYNITTQIH